MSFVLNDYLNFNITIRMYSFVVVRNSQDQNKDRKSGKRFRGLFSIITRLRKYMPCMGFFVISKGIFTLLEKLDNPKFMWVVRYHINNALDIEIAFNILLSFTITKTLWYIISKIWLQRKVIDINTWCNLSKILIW